jgi:hypothetical protein
MALKMEGALRTLPELIERVRSIEQKIEKNGNK